MSESRSTMVAPLPDLPPGSALTPLSARVWRWVRSSINALLAMQGRDGIEVHRAEAGYVVGLSKELKEQIADPGTGGEGNGSLNWAGVWNSSDTYEVGDVVIRSTALNMAEADAGTFVCIQEHANQEPPSGETMDSAYWDTFARGHWIRIVADDGNGKLDALGGRITIEMDAEDPPTTIDLGRTNAIPAALVGKTFYPQVWDICVDGVTKKIGVITTDPWIPE